MAKLRFAGFTVVLLAATQAGCTAMPYRAQALRPSLEVPRPTCDTSVRYIHLATRLRNDTNRDIHFDLVGDRGPPLDLWYMGYRVHSSAPGQPFGLVHNSGQDSVPTRKVSIAPGNSADFNVPIFGLRPADYLSIFRIELRDSRGRSYWTRPFDLCSVPRATCGCPPVSALSVNSQTPRQSCPAASLGNLANAVTQIEVGAGCQ